MKNEYDCIASIVVYNDSTEMLQNAIERFLDTRLKVKLYLFDNSPTPALKTFLGKMEVIYHFNNKNVGYGRAHNWCVDNAERSKYHLVLNPDVVISKGTIEELIKYMEANQDVGMVCPKVLNEDGTIQYLNKRHPNLLDLFIRRLLPHSLRPLFQKRLDRYEMKDVGYDRICDVPFMTGAFMLCRTDVLNLVSSFDPRYFMYFEDADLSRKVQLKGFRTVFYPYVSITHLWERAAHKNLKMTIVFIVNGIKYFSKWGVKLF